MTSPRSTIRIDLRRLAAVCLIAVGTGTGLSIVHDHQLQRAAAGLRAQALAAREAGQDHHAVRQLSRYAQLVPEDTDAIRLYAELLGRIAPRGELRTEIFELNEAVLRRRPQESDIRASQARLALELGRVPDAAAHVDTVESARELDAELWYIRGRCCEASGDTTNAIEAYEQALEQEPNCVSAAGRLAELLSEREHNPAAADQLVNNLVQRTGSAEAFLLRARRYTAADNEDAALKDLQRAVGTDPTNRAAAVEFAAAVCSRLAATVRAEDDPLRTQAISSLSEHVAADPEHRDIRLLMIRLLWLAPDDRSRAIDLLREGLELEPGDAVQLFLLADSLVSLRRLREARELLPRFAEDETGIQRRTLIRARVLMADAHWQDARTVLSGLVIARTGDQEVLSRARLYDATCLSQLGDDDAEIWRETLRRDPESPDARLGLAAVCLNTGQVGAAITEYRKLKSIPGVSAFLADLLIDTALRKPEAMRNWKEVAELVANESSWIADPVERALLRADLLFAQNRSRHAWTVLTEIVQRHPARTEARHALDLATGRLLDEVLRDLERGELSPTSHTALTLVSDHWATRSDAGRLAEYFDQYVRSAVERDAVLRRMAVTTIVLSELSERMQQENAPQTAVLDAKADAVSKRLVALQPDAISVRACFLAKSGREDIALDEVHRGTLGSDRRLASAARSLLEFCWDNPKTLDRLSHIVRERLARAPGSVELRGAEAELLAAAGRYESAIELLSTLLREHPRSDRVAGVLSWLQVARNGNSALARKITDPFVAVRRPHRSIQSARACALILSGDAPAAERMLRRLVVRDPRPQHQLYLAWALFERGLRTEARACIDAARLREARLHPLDRELLARLLAPGDESL